MQNNDSLKWERYILDLIYDVDSKFSVEHADSPDFRLARDGNIFGVEITELFKDGSSARLIKIPDYMQHLWDGGEPVHRDDVKGINVATVQITDKDGNLVRDNVKVIISETGSLRDHADALAEHIERKNKAHEGYDHSLSHINLIVGDHFSSGESIGTEYSTAEFFTPRLRAALQDSPFREIFLVTNILYDNAAWVPLRELELMESFMVFVYCIYQSREALDLLEEQDLVHLFALEMENLQQPLTLRDEGGDFAGRGNVGVRYTVDGGTLVHEHDDWPLGDRPTLERRTIELPDAVWAFIQSEIRAARERGAGIETAYVRSVRDAVWPFAPRIPSQSVIAEAVEP